jgi:glycosyltransferase involved in cell wall biosynthesis
MTKNKVLSVVFNEFLNDNRVLNQAISLVEAGSDVTVLAISNNPKLPQVEFVSGFRLIRIPLFYNKKFIYRLRIIRFIYHKLFVFFSFINIISSKVDIIHCHDLNTLHYGVFAKVFNFFRIKLIYDAHEYESERNGLQGVSKIFVKIKEFFLIRFCNRVITVSETIADEYSRIYGIERPTVILNCPKLKHKEILNKDLFRNHFEISPARKIFLYQGYFYPGRGIELVIDAFNQINNSSSVLIFMGEGPLSENIRNQERFGESIFIHPFVSGDVLLEFTSSADYGVAFLEDISLSDRYCLPNKLFEYIAAGLPVIGSGLPELKKFIDENQVGVAASSNDIEGFIGAFKEILRVDNVEFRKNILIARQRFNWSSQEEILFYLYKNL